MHPYSHVQLISNKESFQQQLEQQITRLSQLVDGGETVTLELTQDGQLLSLSVSAEKVVTLQKPLAETREKALSGLLQHNHFSFNLREVEKNVTKAAVAKKASPPKPPSFTLRTESAAGVPEATVSYDLQHDCWVVKADCFYKANDGYEITVKQGFQSDLASIPRVFWYFLAPNELTAEAPIFHDLLYRSGGKIQLPAGVVTPGEMLFSRAQADDLFLELMTRSKVGCWKRNVAYLAVRHCGEASWRKA